MMKKTLGAFQVLNKFDGEFAIDENLLDVILTFETIQLENAIAYVKQNWTVDNFFATLAGSINAYDPLTASHSSRVALYSQEVSNIINLSQKRQELLYYAALLHDYGKIAVSEELLNKKGSLTIEEYCKMQEHPAYTKSILEEFNFSQDFKEVPQIASAHHEKMDGSGYPDGLIGEQIPIESRILSVVDVFDALTSKRHYRDRMEFENVMYNMENNAGDHFDRDILNAFKKITIGRLLEILEIDNIDKLDKNDLKFLFQFEINQLIEIINFGTIDAGKKKILHLFHKYYYRVHLNDFDETFKGGYKLVNI